MLISVLVGIFVRPTRTLTAVVLRALARLKAGSNVSQEQLDRALQAPDFLLPARFGEHLQVRCRRVAAAVGASLSPQGILVTRQSERCGSMMHATGRYTTAWPPPC